MDTSSYFMEEVIHSKSFIQKSFMKLSLDDSQKIWYRCLAHPVLFFIASDK